MDFAYDQAANTQWFSALPATQAFSLPASFFASLHDDTTAGFGSHHAEFGFEYDHAGFGFESDHVEPRFEELTDDPATDTMDPSHTQDAPGPVVTTLSNARRPTCAVCQTSYKHQKSLNRHISSKHLGLVFLCRTCGLGFERIDSRTRHEAEKHGNKSGTVECMTCGSHVVQRYLEQHQSTQRCRNAQAVQRVQSRVNSATSSLTLTALEVADPCIIVCKLFFHPSLSNHVYWRPSTEILQLRGLAFATIRRTLADATLACTIEALSAIGMTSITERIIGGPGAGKVHTRTFFKLRRQYQKTHPHIAFKRMIDVMVDEPGRRSHRVADDSAVSSRGLDIQRWHKVLGAVVQDTGKHRRRAAFHVGSIFFLVSIYTYSYGSKTTNHEQIGTDS